MSLSRYARFLELYVKLDQLGTHCWILFIHFHSFFRNFVWNHKF
jgi:hypothetical protein